MASPSPTTYGDCVASLRTSLNFLESSVNTLGNGVADFPRLKTVLKSVRHYELIPQPTLTAAESSLRTEITPFITLLLDRADQQVQRRERRIETLKARSELQHGRLSEDHRKLKTKDTTAASSGPAKGRRLDGEARLRAKAVRQKKEGLQYGVERLELEVLQKERELRKTLEA